MWQVIEDMEHAIQMGLRAEEIVYTFQLPHPRWNFSHRIKQTTYFPNRDGRELDYSRWQQSLIGVLMIDIEYDEEVQRSILASHDLTNLGGATCARRADAGGKAWLQEQGRSPGGVEGVCQVGSFTISRSFFCGDNIISRQCWYIEHPLIPGALRVGTSTVTLTQTWAWRRGQAPTTTVPCCHSLTWDLSTMTSTFSTLGLHCPCLLPTWSHIHCEL